MLDEKESSGEEVLESEKRRKYNFEAIEKMEVPMIDLILQLKYKIESGEYNTLLSDDVNARIPTLAIRAIMKEKSPEPPSTFFVAAGMDFPKDVSTRKDVIENRGDYGKALNYLAKLNFGKGKILIVTEFIQSGRSLLNMGRALQELRDLRIIKNDFDFLALAVDDDPNIQEYQDYSLKTLKDYMCSEVYIPHSSTRLTELPSHAVGVKKKKYSEGYHPLVDPIISNLEDSDIEFYLYGDGKAPNLTNEDVKKILDSLLSRNQGVAKSFGKEQVLKKIKMAREDVKLMAERIIEKVWPEESQK